MARKAGWVIGLLVVVGAQSAWAARMPIHEAAESQEYGRKTGGMIGRGLLNVATCFVDVVVNTVNGTKAGPPLVGTLTGAAKGLGCGVLRAASGVVDVVTFWVPGFNGMPVSDSYEDCLLVGAPAFHGGTSLEPSEPALEAWTTPTAPESPSSDVTTAPSVAEPQPPAAPTKSQWKK